MSFEKYNDAENFTSADCLSLFDKIPEWRQGVLEQITNMSGKDVEMLRDSIGFLFDDLNQAGDEEVKIIKQKVKRVGEILTVLSNQTEYGEDVEKNDIPEKIKELNQLLQL